MPKKPRVFLFYGTNNWASLQALHTWEKLFFTKYGELSRYLLDADELTADQLARQLSTYLEGDTLFATPKLVLVKRVTAQDKGKAAPMSQVLIKTIENNWPVIDQTLTLVIWEAQALAETHPLLKAMREWSQEGKAELRSFSLPTGREVAKQAEKYLVSQGGTLDKEAVQFITQQYTHLERQARLKKRLKSSEELLEDERGWWLYRLLEGGMLRAENGVVTVKALQAGLQVMESPVAAFDLVNAITQKKWQQARQLLRVWEESEEEDSSYFGLYAALRWQLKRQGKSEKSLLMLQHLAEIELISKNFPIPHPWLVGLLIDRLEEVAQGRDSRPLIQPRQLWLATLLRSL